MKQPRIIIKSTIALTLLAAAICQAQAAAQTDTVAVETLRRVGTVDEHFQSYNIEMLEVTGGKFWKPYADKNAATQADAGKESVPAGMAPSLYAYREPVDLSNPRLRKLASALAPAYVRTSGTWANTTFLSESSTAPGTPPKGFNAVLTRQQWKGLVDFSRAVNAPIVTSFSTGPGVRDSQGDWQPTQARQFLDYTQSLGGHIVAAEFMNEPNVAEMGGAPAGYNAAAYGRDFKIFHAFIRQAAPKLMILGPGAVGTSDGTEGASYGMKMLNPADLLKAAGPGVDGFSYHHYGAVSKRCAPMAQTTEQAALTEDWLSRTDQTLAFYQKLRDTFEPGKPMWLTEVADAACGGNPWASTFRDTFRYLDQNGRLAKQGVQVVAHNTLVASDYGLLDEHTFAPKPNYWGALLWSQLMGTTVLDSGIPIRAGLHTYAQCLKGSPGGVAVLALNTDETNSQTINLTHAAQRYTLASTGDLDSKTVALNGKVLSLGSNDELPPLSGVQTAAGKVELKPATITFLTLANANNQACR